MSDEENKIPTHSLQKLSSFIYSWNPPVQVGWTENNIISIIKYNWQSVHVCRMLGSNTMSKKSLYLTKHVILCFHKDPSWGCWFFAGRYLLLVWCSKSNVYEVCCKNLGVACVNRWYLHKHVQICEWRLY